MVRDPESNGAATLLGPGVGSTRCALDAWASAVALLTAESCAKDKEQDGSVLTREGGVRGATMVVKPMS